MKELINRIQSLQEAKMSTIEKYFSGVEDESGMVNVAEQIPFADLQKCWKEMYAVGKDFKWPRDSGTARELMSLAVMYFVNGMREKGVIKF